MKAIKVVTEASEPPKITTEFTNVRCKKGEQIYFYVTLCKSIQKWRNH